MNPEILIAPALTLLPAVMNTAPAVHMVLAIGYQESGFTRRRQMGNGPARSFWQFEVNGVKSVLQHPASQQHVQKALALMDYCVSDVGTIMRAIEHNDILAFIFARLLLWTLPQPLPGRDDIDGAWAQYIAAWRPGKPRRGDWFHSFTQARRIVFLHSRYLE